MRSKGESQFDLYYDEKLSRQNYDEKFSQTYENWQRFVNGNLAINNSIIPGYIMDSWVRCRRYGVNPGQATVHDALSGRELQECLERNESLIASSLPFMQNLYSFLQGSGFVISLCDRKGVLIMVTGDRSVITKVQRGNFVQGASWTEAEAGTNGVGTLLEVRRPLQIFAGQHYCKDYHRQTASSAPIFDPQGEFIGGIVMTGRYYKTTPHTLGMTVAAAQAIENELLMKKALMEIRLANSYQETVMSSIPEAMITINNKGFISTMNENAKRIFSHQFKNIKFQDIAEMFGHKNEQLFKLINQKKRVTDVEVRISTNNQVNDYTLTTNTIRTPEGEYVGKLIILNEIKRVKTLVNKMIGAKAKLSFDDICGASPKFLEIINQAYLASQSNSNALLLGKSGTGKDIISQAIHNASSRKHGPYLAINCAAIPRDLIASELFGYTEGAFTGSRRGGGQGKFELADGGTIFLDEIAEIPLELQAVLLRVIEDKSVTRIGGTQVRLVNVRIVAATNKNLSEEIEKGTFREDLYYRLNVFVIHMPSLNERLDDIPLLVDLFVARASKTMGKRIDKISNKVIESFINYPWPGNVRELQNTIERMMNFVKSNELTEDLIPKEIREYHLTLTAPSNFESLEDVERQMLVSMLDKTITKSQIAKKMRISRTTLYRKLEKYGLSQ